MGKFIPLSGTGHSWIDFIADIFQFTLKIKKKNKVIVKSLWIYSETVAKEVEIWYDKKE